MKSIIIFGFVLLCISCVSCGIIRQEDIPLLANERISKRSISDHPTVLHRHKRTLLLEQLRTPIMEDLEPAANTAMAYYRRRQGRSVDVVPLLRDDDSNVSDLDIAENVVFFPLFRTRRIIKRRIPRDVAKAISNKGENSSRFVKVLEGKVGQDGNRRRIQ